MAITKNVGRTEGILRVVLGVALIVWGLFLSVFWQVLSLVAGVGLILTAFVGY